MKIRLSEILTSKYTVVVIAGMFMVSVAVSIGTYLIRSLNQDDFGRLSLLASEHQVLVHKIAKYSTEAGSGNERAFEHLRSTMQRASELESELYDVNKVKIPSIKQKLENASTTWQLLKSQVDPILASQLVIISADEIVQEMENTIQDSNRIVSKAASDLVATGTAEQIYYTTSLLFLIERVNTNLRRVLVGGRTSVYALDELTRDTDGLDKLLSALVNGDQSLSLEPINDSDILTSLEVVSHQLSDIRANQNRLLEMISELITALDALGSTDDALTIGASSTQLLSDVTDELAKLDLELGELFASHSGLIALGPLNITAKFVTASQLVSGLLFILFITLLMIRSRSKERATAAVNDRNQAAIRQLLNEISRLAEGDLTTEATVTEGVTGAIADSINVAIESMRDVVTAIYDTSSKVSDSSIESRKFTKILAQLAIRQRKEAADVNLASKNISHSMTGLATKASELASLAETSLRLSASGGQAVSKNVEGMEQLRGHIQATAKRIKRLGESSQEIGSIVDLINSITDQTNILAMNASMPIS